METNKKDGRWSNKQKEEMRLKQMRDNPDMLKNSIESSLGLTINEIKVIGGRDKSYDLTVTVIDQYNNIRGKKNIELKGSTDINFDKIIPYASLSSPGITQTINETAKDKIFDPIKLELYRTLPYLKRKYDIVEPIPTVVEWLSDACCAAPKTPLRKRLKSLRKTNNQLKNDLTNIEIDSVNKFTISVYNNDDIKKKLHDMASQKLRSKMQVKDIIVICKYPSNDSLIPTEIRSYNSYQITETKIGLISYFQKYMLPTLMFKTNLSGENWMTVPIRPRRRNGVGACNLTWSV